MELIFAWTTENLIFVHAFSITCVRSVPYEHSLESIFRSSHSQSPFRHIYICGHIVTIAFEQRSQRATLYVYVYMGGFRMCCVNVSPIPSKLSILVLGPKNDHIKRFYIAMCSSFMLEIDQKAINFFSVCVWVCALLLSQCCRFKFQFIYLELKTVKKHDKSNFKCISSIYV